MPSAPALAILIFSEIFVFYSLVHYEIAISVNKQRYFLLFTALAALVNVALNLVLIPRYGIIGASIATFFSYILSAGLIIGSLIPSMKIYNMAGCRVMIRPLIASVIMGICVYFLRQHLVFAIIGGVVTFFMAMLLIGGIDGEDFRIIKSVFKREGCVL